jgi:CDP-L-myo-inositol myo-inositolphosphotransferase
MKVEKALVLAAGKSSRFGRHKMVHKIEGTSLLGRVLQTLKDSGVKSVYVVVGYEKDNIIREIGKKYVGLEVNYVAAKNWEKGNLHSFLSAKGIFKENFILCMGDHIFDSRIVKKLADADFDPNSENVVLYLAIDRNSYSDDDTRVLEINGRIIRIGKYLKTYNCTDTGFFLCSPKVFSYAEICAERGDSELAQCIQLVAEKGLAKVIDVSGLLWIDVDTEKDLERTYGGGH